MHRYLALLAAFLFVALTSAASPAAPEKTDKPFTYDLPKGWEEQGPRPMRLVSFAVKEGDQAADVSVIALPGDAGGVTANVNRWRGQVGLPLQTDEEVKAALRPIKVGGLDGQLVDLAGAGDGAKRMLAVMVEREGQTWYFKMIGPAALVGKEAKAFEAFIGSVKFARK